MKKALFLLLFATFALLSSAQTGDEIVGTWINPAGTGKIKIFKSGDYYFGNLVWIDKPLDENGKPKLDEKNPDKTKRSRKIQGLLMLTGFTYNAKDKVYENGEIYDPKSGNTYSCKMTMNGKDKLDIRGFIGISLIGRSETWKRVE